MRWKLDDGRTLELLTPAQLVDVKPGTRLVSVNGDTAVVGVDHIDQDTRCGYLAWGRELPPGA